MSTSSGRDGFCIYCGHFLNEHTAHRDAKCKKCKQPFEICQARAHGTSTAWMLCFKPCGHDEKYWPDAAKAATKLPQECWAETHPHWTETATRQRALSEESVDPIIGHVGTPHPLEPKGKATVRAGDFRNQNTDLDELADKGNMSSLSGTLAGLNIGDDSDAVGLSSSKPKAKKSKGSKPNPSGGASSWRPTVDQVDQDKWTIWDPEKKKPRAVFQDPEGYWYFQKKDGSPVYLQ